MENNGIAELKKLKDRHGLTWPKLAAALGRSKAVVENWYTGNARIPPHTRLLIQIFLDDKEIFKKYRLDK